MNSEQKKLFEELEKRTLSYQLSQLREMALAIFCSFCEDFKIFALIRWLDRILTRKHK